MAVLNWIEEHPYLSGGGVLGVIVLFFLLNSGSSSSASNSIDPSTGLTGSESASLQAAQIASGTQLQQSQDAVTAQQNSDNAAVAQATIQAQAQVTAAQLAQQVALQNIVTSGQVTENTNDTNLQIAQVQTGGQVQINKQNNDASVSVAGIQGDILDTQYNDAVASQKIIADAQTAQAQANDNLLASIYATLKGGGGTSSYNPTNLRPGVAPISAPSSSITPSWVPQQYQPALANPMVNRGVLARVGATLFGAK